MKNRGENPRFLGESFDRFGELVAPPRRVGRDGHARMKAVKRMSPDGQITVARSDIYGGAIIPFVPFTGSHQS